MTYFSAESRNGASLRMYPSHTHDGELTMEVTIGSTAFRVALDDELAHRVAAAMVRWYAPEDDLSWAVDETNPNRVRV